MDEHWNDLLKRQVWKHFRDMEIPEELFPLLESVSTSYTNFEKEHRLLERVMDLSSEELYESNSELRKRNQELDQFVYSTSHDLRAPLTSILGVLAIAKTEDDIDQLHQLISLMETSASRLDDFISEVIGYSRNKKAPVVIGTINFQELVESCIARLDFMPNANGIKFEIEIDEQKKFFGDSTRLEIIISNLISNAIKYSDPEKESSFALIKITTDPNLKLIVEDNGIGISERSVPTIFEMFKRATSHGYGSGIGLYILKETLDKLKGTVKVQSVEGEGTTFEISIPNQQEVR